MPYCLVCLASGTKDPCVRCGQRPSKRVEQLVHLRLKSIYKAFKQSGATLEDKKEQETSAKKDESPNNLSLNGDVGAVLQAAASAAARTSTCSQSVNLVRHNQQKMSELQRLAKNAQKLNQFEKDGDHGSDDKRDLFTTEHVYSRTQAEADAAAAALLAELEEEEKQPIAKSNKVSSCISKSCHHIFCLKY